MSKTNGENSPTWQKLCDLESKNSYSKYLGKGGGTNDTLGNADSIFSEDDGYGVKMQRGPKELMAFKILDRAVRSLSKRQRDAYKLVYKDGFTLAAAGLMMGGISPQGVKKNLGSALKNIAAFCKLHESELDHV